ncbi:MAG: DUF4321 domain-containing protein [Clostridia bacterium]|nr:DUF4321 domain-containing protein [Clostridia bacterium]
MRKYFWYNLLFILIGVVLGSLVSSLTSGVSFLSWLSFGKSFGIESPFMLDLSILKITFALMINLNVSTIIFIILSLLIGNTIIKK